MKFNLSMRTSLILSVIVLVWGTHLLLAPSFYLLSEKTFYSHAHDIMDNISDFTLEQSYNHLEKAKGAVTLTKQLLSANVFNTGTLTISSLERYFFDQLKIHPHLAGIYLGTPDGSFYYVSRNEAKKKNGFRTKIIRHNERERSVMLIWRDENFRELQREQTPADPYDPRKHPWYKQAVQSRAIGWTDPYIFYTSKQPGVTIAGPSYWEDNSLKGVIGVDIDLKELSSFVGKLRVGKTGKAMAAVNNQIAPESLFDLKKPVFTSFTAQKQDFVAMFTPFPGTELDWIVAMYLPEEDYLGKIRSNRRTNLIATVLLSLIASILAFRFARAIIAPIKCLQQEARAIEDQDLQVDCTLNSVFTELQETADGFKRMKQSIANYSEKLRAQEKMYRIITNAASDAIILINEKREISYLNPAAEDFFALASEEARGEKCP
ncbi:PAS domain S-box [Desulfocapsa sulfexigens DSM 10523]|uniref:histidine kinase n=1 Tax=Desulfocapsa sulfexigens (strain DSM 10523 / SB164P1) TaxID=1167006 RepID=M1P8Y1_DESSD|nr:cache domain-containing protein [Desulfocapsa sulfexigens]AGF78112.1 PAS domain S-box [Desulfocapsa sulfexigens DSM 10523]